MFTYRLKWLLCFIVLVAVVSIWLAETHQGISPLALLEARERCKEIPYGTPPAKVIELAGIKRFVAAETKTRVSTEYFIEADWHDSQVSVIAPNPTWSGGVNLKADWGNVRMQANDDSWRDYRRAVLTGFALLFVVYTLSRETVIRRLAGTATEQPGPPEPPEPLTHSPPRRPEITEV